MALKFEFTADEIVKEGRVSHEDMDEIRAWTKCKNLNQMTDEQIVLFLLSCENDLDRAKCTISAYFKYTGLGPKIFNNRDINSKEMEHQITIVESCVIPRRTKDNYLVIFQRLKNFSHWNFNLEASMKYLFMTLDVGLQKGNPPDGLIALFDMKGLGLLHLTKLRMGPLKIFFGFLQEGLPCQIRAIHVFNTAFFVDKLIAIIKPLMKKELYDALHFHPASLDMEKFFEECVDAECVPSDYGGKSPSVQVLESATLEELRSKTEWFEIEEGLRK